jgi:hypothetical protein
VTFPLAPGFKQTPVSRAEFREVNSKKRKEEVCAGDIASISEINKFNVWLLLLVSLIYES